MPEPALFLVLLGAPLVSALLAIAGPAAPRPVAVLTGLLALGSLGAALGLAARVVAGGVPAWGPGELFRVDALSAVLAVCVAFVSALPLGLGPGRGPQSAGEGARFRA